MVLELHDLLTAEFEENGEGPNYDCWNLCREVYRRVGRILPRYSDYIATVADRNNLISIIKEDDFIRIDKPEFLSIVTFQLRPRMITHMGVVIDKHRFIHVRKKCGVAIERLDTGQWSKRIEGFYRYAGTD
jgi:cell wall-associated NlpC family hydrolase